MLTNKTTIRPGVSISLCWRACHIRCKLWHLMKCIRKHVTNTATITPVPAAWLHHHGSITALNASLPSSINNTHYTFYILHGDTHWRIQRFIIYSLHCSFSQYIQLLIRLSVSIILLLYGSSYDEFFKVFIILLGIGYKYKHA